MLRTGYIILFYEDMSIVFSSRQFKYAGLFFLSLMAVLIWLAIFWQSPDDKLKVFFFDIGQGSAVFIEAPNKNQILIDGGPGDQILAKLGQIMPFYDRTIDLLILTHPDADHLNGLIEVLKRYQIKQVLETGISENSAPYQLWQSLIKQKNISVKIAQAGQLVKIADGLRLDILYPLANLENKTISNTNRASIVSRLLYGQISFLFTGDADQAVEQQLLNNNFDLVTTILNVGHHGSRSSTSEAFARKVQPRLAVIQVGRNNRYGHPNQEVLQRLKDMLILRTDINKDIKLISDGKNFSYY